MEHTGCLKKKGDVFIGPQIHRFTHPVFLQCALVGYAKGQCHHHSAPWPNLPMHTEENTGCVKP